MLLTGPRAQRAALKQQHQQQPRPLARTAAAAAAPAAPTPPPPRAPATANAPAKKTATPPTARRPAAVKPAIQRDFARGTGAARPWPDTLRVDARSDVSGAAGSLAKALRAIHQQHEGGGGGGKGAAAARRAPTAAAPAVAPAPAGGGGIAPAPAAARPPVVRLWARDRPAAWRALASIALADRMLRQTDGRMIVFQPTVVTRGEDEEEQQGRAAAAAAAQRGGGGGKASSSTPSTSGPKLGEYAFFVATLPAGEIVADNILTASRSGAVGGASGGEAAEEEGQQQQEGGEAAEAAAEAAAPVPAPAPAAPPAARGGRGRRGGGSDGLAADAAEAAEQSRALSRAVMARVLGRGHTAVEARGARAAAIALDAAIGARRGLLVRARDAAVLIGSNSGIGAPGSASAAASVTSAASAPGEGGAKLMRLVVVECAPRDVTAVRLRAAGEGGVEPAAAVRRV